MAQGESRPIVALGHLNSSTGRKLQMQTLRALAVGMPGVPAGFFEEYHTDGDNQLRLLHCEIHDHSHHVPYADHGRPVCTLAGVRDWREGQDQGSHRTPVQFTSDLVFTWLILWCRISRRVRSCSRTMLAVSKSRTQ